MTLIKISSVFEDIYQVLETSVMNQLFDGKSMNLLLSDKKYLKKKLMVIM